MTEGKPEGSRHAEKETEAQALCTEGRRKAGFEAPGAALCPLACTKWEKALNRAYLLVTERGAVLGSRPLLTLQSTTPDSEDWTAETASGGTK